MVSAPPSPDPEEVAGAQTTANVNAAIGSSIVNNPEEETPYGTVRYGRNGWTKIKNPDGGYDRIPRYTRTVKLAPQERKKLEQQNSLQLGMLGLGNTQVRRVGRTLSSPVNFDKGVTRRVDTVDTPDLQSDMSLDRLNTSFDTGPAPTTSIGDLQRAASSYRSGGNVVRSYDTGPALQTSLGADANRDLRYGFDTGPAIDTSLQSSPTLQKNFYKGPQVDTSLYASPNLQTSYDIGPAIDTSLYGTPTLQTGYNTGGPVGGPAGMFINTAGRIRDFEGSTDYQQSYAPEDGFSEDRQRVEEALMYRMQPDLDRDQAALEAQLAAQGLQRGTAEFEEAMMQHGRNVNDARMQSVLAGGQEQSRMLNEARSAADFENTWESQGYQDEAQSYNINLDAQQQRFDQRLQGYNANLTTQAQRYAQNAALAAFTNSAMTGQYDMDMYARQDQRAAIDQYAAQNAQLAAFGNAAMSEQYGMDMYGRQDQRAAIDQVYNQNMGHAQFKNDALTTQFGVDQSARQDQRAAIDQNYQQNLGEAQFYNNTALSDAERERQNMAAQNAARGQVYDQNAQLAAFQNAAQAQANAQNYQALQARNSAVAQNNQTEMDRIAAENAARGQLFAQNQSGAAFGNTATAQNNQYSQQELEYYNYIMQQAYGNQMSSADFQNAQRQAQIQEDLAQRNQVINEISALMNGGQVNVPQFQDYARQGIDPAPIGEYMYRSAEMEQQQHNAMMSGLFGLGSSLVAAPFMLSDRRAKKNIKRVGKTDKGTPIYTYKYKQDPSGLVHMGVMAQDLAKSKDNDNREAVKRVGPGNMGLMAVDYSKVA